MVDDHLILALVDGTIRNYDLANPGEPSPGVAIHNSPPGASKPPPRSGTARSTWRRGTATCTPSAQAECVRPANRHNDRDGERHPTVTAALLVVGARRPGRRHRPRLGRRFDRRRHRRGTSARPSISPPSRPTPAPIAAGLDLHRGSGSILEGHRRGRRRCGRGRCSIPRLALPLVHYAEFAAAFEAGFQHRKLSGRWPTMSCAVSWAPTTPNWSISTGQDRPPPPTWLRPRSRSRTRGIESFQLPGRHQQRIDQDAGPRHRELGNPRRVRSHQPRRDRPASVQHVHGADGRLCTRIAALPPGCDRFTRCPQASGRRPFAATWL